jgi:PD-(D/E)XK nuclease superfamily
MTYSYTQIAQYLRCPRSYRYRYLDGWKEKDSRATLLFGRCFEQALGAYFRREDSSAALFTYLDAIVLCQPLEQLNALAKHPFPTICMRILKLRFLVFRPLPTQPQSTDQARAFASKRERLRSLHRRHR